jgi:hypothetical protein
MTARHHVGHRNLFRCALLTRKSRRIDAGARWAPGDPATVVIAVRQDGRVEDGADLC